MAGGWAWVLVAAEGIFMLVMRQTYTETLILMVVSIGLLMGGGFAIYHRLTRASFSTDAFVYQQQAWQSQQDFEQWQAAATELESALATLSSQQFRSEYTRVIQMIPSTYHQYASAARHLGSSRAQIQDLAQQIILSVQQTYPLQQFRFVDRVYAMDPLISIVLNRPLAYLFFLESGDQSELLILAWHPDSADTYQQLYTWHFAQEQLPSQDFLDNLLLLYSKNIR